MNKLKLDDKLFELTKRFPDGEVYVKDLKEIIDAILEEKTNE